ncbi:acyl carrier protein [Brevibacillus centrosporus]|uniref:Acyl carrier protein n=1 Tax=Brevibacillus centrosporus TaxID=54910 RepID=A0A1I4E237_9BACL|nr:acyl carrier protein [Brevibacillus centrosporus]SFK99822.1 Acyl carrier protein [Brevibacillus centrosporus]
MTKLENVILRKVQEILNRDVTLDKESNLFNEGFTSLILIELIVSIEEEYNIQIEDGDLTLDNFQTVNSICELLLGKYGV